MNFTVDKFNEVKHEAENFYSSLEKVYCPYFQEHVHFNKKGLDHIVFKGWNCTRPIEDQFTRFRHLKLAPEVVKNSRTLKGLWSTSKFERVKKKNGNWEKILKNTRYYEFIAVMESHGSNIRVKVIIKQIDGGEKFFLSIIPFWGVGKRGERILHNGNPEED